MKDDIDVADFSKLLNNNKEIDVDYLDQDYYCYLCLLKS